MRDARAGDGLGKLEEEAEPDEVEADRDHEEADGGRRRRVEDERRQSGRLTQAVQADAVADRAQVAHALVHEYAMDGHVARRRLVHERLVAVAVAATAAAAATTAAA